MMDSSGLIEKFLQSYRFNKARPFLVGRSKLRVFEVGITYSGRTYEEGKKVNWQDGLAAIWHIIRFGIGR